MRGANLNALARVLACVAALGCAACASARAVAQAPAHGAASAQASANASANASAQASTPPHGLPFTGRWLRDEQPGAQPRYPVLVVEDGQLRWRGADKATPDCVQPFTLRPEQPGSVYTDGRGRKFVAGAKGSFPTYLLDVGASPCGGAGGQARISYPLAYDVAHIEFIDYAGGKPVGVRRFHRKP